MSRNRRLSISLFLIASVFAIQAVGYGSPSATLDTYVTIQPGDATPPTTTLTTVPSGPDGLGDWFVTQPSITLTPDESATTYYSWVSNTGSWTTYGSSFNALLGQNTLHYYSQDAAGNPEIPKSQLFKVDTSIPSSTITAPSAGARLKGANYVITGTSSDTYSGVSKVEVSINGGGWNLATGTTNWSYTWTLPADGSYNIKSRATDTAGNAETPSAGTTVTVDNTAPTVTSTSPASGATGVAVGADITAIFSEDMDASTITGTTFTLANGGSVAGVVIYDSPSKTATFNPTGDLSYSITYTATVTTGAKDLAGNGLSVNKVWTFTTAAAPDNAPPVTTLTTNPTSPDLPGNWFSTAPLITLVANEPAITYYSWISSTGPWTTYSAPFRAPTGNHTLYYYSVDTALNKEAVKSQPFKVKKK